MAVVIRLQGLRITAGSGDIRNFFSGLKILDGGVHIIGGERAEAFIIFASDEDARRAMTRSGGLIKGSPINLLLSSKSEMQSIIEASTITAELDQKRSHKEGPRRREMDVSVGARRAGHPESGIRSGHSHGEARHDRRASSNSFDDLYLFLKGMPFSVTEEEICHFFHGLLVDGIILMKNARGQNNGIGIVKFATRMDAEDGLKRDREYIGSRFVEVYRANEEHWHAAGGDMAGCVHSNGNLRRGKSPAHTQRSSQDVTRSRSPLPDRSTSPSNEDFCVLLENLSYVVEKRDIKELFHHARLQDDQILYLLDSMGRRTRSVFVLFKSLRDYNAALTHHKEEFLSRFVYISPISREKMISILESCKNGSPNRSGRSQERLPREQGDPYDSEKVCLYVRNMPFDVRKVEIMDFFLGFNITEDNVVLVRDHTGAGLGEALVVFRSEGEAMSAQALNGQRFLGSEVMLKCISRSQMREFRVEPPVVQELILRDNMYSARSTGASYHPDDVEYPGLRIPPRGNMQRPNLQVQICGGSSLDPCSVGPYGPQDGGNGSGHVGFGPPMQHFDGPTCLKLVNLPSKIKIDEIYDFCYGYRFIPGSVSLQYDKNGATGSATVVFESRQEALTAVEELSGRPIGARKIQLLFV